MSQEVVYHNRKEEYDKLGISLQIQIQHLKSIQNSLRSTLKNWFRQQITNLWPLTLPSGQGGTFIYVPKGVKVDIPLQTYFRINNEATAQFERTFIIVDEGASVHYVEGCTAPTYTTASLHAAIVEIFALDGAFTCATQLFKTGQITSTTW